MQPFLWLAVLALDFLRAGSSTASHPHTDPSKFVQCDEWLQCFVMRGWETSR